MTDSVHSANAETKSMQARGDRDLLELAAKAAGMGRGQWDYDYVRGLGHMVTPPMMWNPLTNDGEALRLAVKCGITIDAYGTTTTAWSSDFPESCMEVPHDSDPYTATRRAIVRAAAEVGRSMS